MSVKTTTRRSGAVLLSYGVFSLWGIGCFMASLFLSKGGFAFAPGDLLAIFGILVAAVIGHVIGNLLGLAGFRLGPIVALFVALIVGGTFAGVVLGPLAVFPLIAVFAALGGYLGIGSRLDVVASWYPLTFAVGAAVMWMNAHGAMHTFKSGEKHALWDPFTLVCLGGAVFFMLVFLATRNSLGLTVWQEVGRPRGPGLDPGEGITVARPGRGSFFVLFFMTIVILGTTALVSPYLFRTAHDDNAKDGSSEQKQKPRKCHGGQGDDDGQSTQNNQREDSKDESSMEQIGDLLKILLRLFLYLLVFALILLFLVYGVLPPFRRRFLLKHLMTPLWPVPPTARVMNLWQRALVALLLLDIEPAPGEPPTALAARVERELQEPTPGLAVAAAIVEKINYAGRGLGSGEEQAMRGAILELLAALEPRISFKKKLAAAWGQTPDVQA